MSTDSDPDSTDWGAVGFVLAGKYREPILQALADGPQMPTELVDETDIRMDSASSNLADLRERGLVELLSPDDQEKGRVYALTEKGEAVLQAVRDR